MRLWWSILVSLAIAISFNLSHTIYLRDGTSDVTRSWHFGTPTDFEKEAFTRVLKGQILMGSSVFPSKIKGATLDTLARKSLWDVGLDYGHGTVFKEN